MKKYVWIKMKRFGVSHHGGMPGKIDRTFWDSQIDFFG